MSSDGRSDLALESGPGAYASNPTSPRSDTAAEIAEAFHLLSLGSNDDQQREPPASTFAIHFTPEGDAGDEDGPSMASGADIGGETEVGPAQPAAREGRSSPHDSALGDDLAACVICGRLREYCHGHDTPALSPAPLPTRPRHAPARLVETFHLNRDQAAALATRLTRALQADDENTRAVPTYAQDRADDTAAPPEYQARGSTSEGLGVPGRRNRGRGRSDNLQPNHPLNPRPAAAPTASVRRPVSPTPAGYEHNRGARYIPFRIPNPQGGHTPARFTQVHLTGCCVRHTRLPDLGTK